MKKKHVILIAVLTAGLTLVHAQSGGTTVQGNSLADKLNWLNVFAQSNTSYIVEVNANENIGNQNLSYSGKSGITITLRGVGSNRTISGGISIGNLPFEGSGSITLVLDNNITLRECSVTVFDSGSLIMNNGSTITGGGGVSVGGTFTMNGGTISGNTASYYGGVGGVSVGGTFTMNGGTISGNTGSYYGGVGGVSVGGTGTFTMNGGTISGNRGELVDGQVRGGGGVRVVGTFTMNGGTISGNSGGSGVYVSSDIPRGKFGTFTMRDGTVSGNTASYGGGGVFVDLGTFTMSGGTISGNTASENGGGVYVAGGTFTKTGGTITGYTSDQRNGNVVKNSSGAVQNYRGHAVYANAFGNALLKIREGTAGPEDNMSFTGRTNPPTASGAWDN